MEDDAVFLERAAVFPISYQKSRMFRVIGGRAVDKEKRHIGAAKG